MSGLQPVLTCERDAQIARITFNRPIALNAIDEEMAGLFNAACQSVSRDAKVRVVVLRGAGRGFVSGGDLRVFDRDPASVATRLIDPVHEAIATLCAMPKPVLGSVHGIVAGAGVGLALACDLVVAADDARFNMAYLKVGASCDAGASWFLPRTVGFRKAMEMALLNPVLDAAEALRIGLVNWVVPGSELSSRTDEVASRLAAEAPLAIGHMKRLVRSSYARGLDDQLAAEREAFRECTGTAQFVEAARAFLDARASRA